MMPQAEADRLRVWADPAAQASAPSTVSVNLSSAAWASHVAAAWKVLHECQSTRKHVLGSNTFAVSLLTWQLPGRSSVISLLYDQHAKYVYYDSKTGMRYVQLSQTYELDRPPPFQLNVWNLRVPWTGASLLAWHFCI